MTEQINIAEKCIVLIWSYLKIFLCESSAPGRDRLDVESLLVATEVVHHHQVSETQVRGRWKFNRIIGITSNIVVRKETKILN